MGEEKDLFAGLNCKGAAVGRKSAQSTGESAHRPEPRAAKQVLTLVEQNMATSSRSLSRFPAFPV